MFTISFIDHPSKIREIKDENLLNQIALTSNNPSHRLVAIECITDQDLLDEIAQTDPLFVCKKTAMEKLTNEGMISKYLISPDLRIRAVANKKIKSQERIEFILLNESDPNLRFRVLNYYWRNDLDLLNTLALYDDNPQIRKDVIQRISDQETILKVALTDENGEVRSIARSKLSPKKENDYRKLLKFHWN